MAGTVITIIASGPTRVTTETIKDRERFPNGSTDLEADEEGTFVVSSKQSLRVEAIEPEPEPEQPADDAEG
jgi:hypothetical protein